MSSGAHAETLHSRLYAGATHCLSTLRPSVEYVDGLLHLTPRQRARTVWRLDASFGSDAGINWVLARDYQLLVKGYSTHRAARVAQGVPAAAWQAVGPAKWYAPVETGLRYARRTQTVALRWLTPHGALKHALLVHNLPDCPPERAVALYDQRGSMEVDIKQDKLGLRLVTRRKRRWNAQEGWLLLTDWAHNLLTWSHGWMLAGSAFDRYGELRLVQDVLSLPGHLEFGGRRGDRLLKVALQRTHPFAGEIGACLERLFRFWA